MPTATPRTAKPTLLQALRDPRMAAVLFLRFASGLPLNLTNFTLQAWLASAGLSIGTIGLFSLAALPYNFKPLWAPLLDRYHPPFRRVDHRGGNRRSRSPAQLELSGPDARAGKGL